jgi:hypothetical protein
VQQNDVAECCFSESDALVEAGQLKDEKRNFVSYFA